MGNASSQVNEPPDDMAEDLAAARAAQMPGGAKLYEWSTAEKAWKVKQLAVSVEVLNASDEGDDDAFRWFFQARPRPTRRCPARSTARAAQECCPRRWRRSRRRCCCPGAAFSLQQGLPSRLRPGVRF